MRGMVRAACTAAIATGLALGLGACGSESKERAPAAAGGKERSKPASFFQQRVDQLYAGASYSEPEGDAPKPQPGKKLWAITYGLAASAGAEAAEGAKEAGEAIGWDVRVFDGKFDPNNYLTGIRQAIAAKADAIYLYAIDCPVVKAGLEDAKEAGVAVVAAEAADCDDLKPGAPSLFTTDNGAYNGGPFTSKKLTYGPWIENWGAAQASAIIAHTKGKAKIIDFYETDTESTLRLDVGLRREVAACAECEIVETVKFTGADFGPSLQAKAEQALLQHPEANAVFGSYDAPITSGIAAAVRASGRSDKLYVSGGEGDPPNVELVREGKGQNGGVADPVAWQSFAAVDALNRVFQGQKSAPNGIGFMLWDKDHNLPQKGEQVQPPIDFKSAYFRSWGVK